MILLLKIKSVMVCSAATKRPFTMYIIPVYAYNLKYLKTAQMLLTQDYKQHLFIKRVVTRVRQPLNLFYNCIQKFHKIDATLT
ncbi:hypothetical protein DQM24_08695 [Lacticaseibacillus paracasei]|nr:hypothetical protein BOQ55_06135 [Lacticaseibacillus casei]RDF81787.1 hypothetical protein DQM24_08695 [Lacticaseibacillus paracasei]TEA88087.1 hypothetical protein TE33_06130 [Lacticaseibacillus paracasei]